MSYRPSSDRDGRSDDHFYSDKRSSPPRRRTPPHDISRSPPRGPASDRDRGRELSSRQRRDDSRDYDSRRRTPPREYDRRDRDYRDRDREDYRSPRERYSSRSRSRSLRPRSRSHSPYYGGAPSREVILEGLPQSITEDDIRKELEKYHEVGTLDDVRVIRDKRTGLSRQFGFLRFPDIRSSTAFLERNYPKIYLYGTSTSDDDQEAAKVRIAFSRERDDRDKQPTDGVWTCKACVLLNFSHRIVCFRCHAPRPESANIAGQSTQFVNNGDNDAAPESIPSQYLLVRGLDSSTSEEVFAKGMTKLYKGGESTSSSNGQPKKPSKVVSTTSSVNLGAQEGSIRRILIVKDKRSRESWRYGFAEFHSVDDAQAAMTKYNASDRFTISSKSISLSYIHAGVFVPVIGAAIKEFTITAASNPSLRLAYWDENAYVSELAVSDAPPTSASKESKGEGKKSAALPDQEGLAGTVSEDSKSKKRKAETEKPGDKKKMMPSHLQFWSDRHAELHGSSGAKLNDQKASAQDKPQQRKSQSSPVTDDPEAPSQSYADPDKHCCYLCSRQFKSATEVNKHERLSQLHRDNLKSEDLKAKAIEKLEKAGIAVLSTSAETASEYHDRAKERRQAHNQPKKPANTSSKNPAKPKPTSSEPDEPAPTPSKGASLLGKMGWSAGEGLGSQGTGMTAPIATDLYTPGVGLGAAGGKMGDATEEAARSTKGDYKEFLQKTKDRAKERYENM